MAILAEPITTEEIRRMLAESDEFVREFFRRWAEMEGR